MELLGNLAFVLSSLYHRRVSRPSAHRGVLQVEYLTWWDARPSDMGGWQNTARLRVKMRKSNLETRVISQSIRVVSCGLRL